MTSIGVWLGGEHAVPDVSVPKVDNANTGFKLDFLKWFFYSDYTRSFFQGPTPDQWEKTKAWRPPRYDERDLSRYDVMQQAKEDLLREGWVKAMMLRLVRDQLNACYKDNGVNHVENCQHLSDLYLKWMREGYRVRGTRVRQKVDWKDAYRREYDSRPPDEAPTNRPWEGIGDDKNPRSSFF